MHTFHHSPRREDLAGSAQRMAAGPHPVWCALEIAWRPSSQVLLQLGSTWPNLPKLLSQHVTVQHWQRHLCTDVPFYQIKNWSQNALHVTSMSLVRWGSESNQWHQRRQHRAIGNRVANQLRCRSVVELEGKVLQHLAAIFFQLMWWYLDSIWFIWILFLMFFLWSR